MQRRYPQRVQSVSSSLTGATMIGGLTLECKYKTFYTTDDLDPREGAAKFITQIGKDKVITVNVLYIIGYMRPEVIVWYWTDGG